MKVREAHPPGKRIETGMPTHTRLRTYHLVFTRLLNGVWHPGEGWIPHAFFLALAPGGMSASGQTTISYHVLLREECHEGIYDKGHYSPRFSKANCPLCSPRDKADDGGETNEGLAALSIKTGIQGSAHASLLNASRMMDEAQAGRSSNHDHGRPRC